MDAFKSFKNFRIIFFLMLKNVVLNFFNEIVVKVKKLGWDSVSKVDLEKQRMVVQLLMIVKKM